LAAIRQALETKYALTTITADHMSAVRPGCVLVLKKSNLVTGDASQIVLWGNTYKNGKISQGRFFIPGTLNRVEGTRVFVSGEKLWLTGIEVKEKEVVFNLYSDAYGDTRYHTNLKFPFEKNYSPTVSGVLATIDEVFDIQQPYPEDAAPPQQTSAAPPPRFATPAPQPAAEAPPPLIAPPPPPPADPKVIKQGQSPEQVVASFGQPERIIKLAAKQIYVYKDMKVVFVSGKVSDVE
jgi:hypothetical protein